MNIIYPGSTILQNDFETSLDGLKESDFNHSSSGIISTSDLNDQNSNNTVKFVLQDPDKREELSLDRVPSNSEITYSFRIFLPDTYVADPVPEIVAQWHAFPDFHLGETWSRTGPVLTLTTVDGEWRVGNKWDSRQIIRESDEQRGLTAEGSISYELGDYQTGVWTDWTFHVRWSHEADGLIEVWQNDNLVLRQTGPNTYNDESGPYLKVGLYNKKWQDTQLTQRELYYDDLEVLSIQEGDYLLSGGNEDNIYVLNNQTAPGSQINDLGGTDTLVFTSGLRLSLEDLLRETNDLLIDINHDGVFDPVNDLTISNFFTSSGDGVGLIETVGNLNSNQILNALALEPVVPVVSETETV